MEGADLEELKGMRMAMARHGPGARIAVIVIDIQNYFFSDPGIRALASIDATNDLLAVARRAGAPVVLTKTIYDAEYEITPAWRARCDLGQLMRGQPGAEFMAELARASTDFVVEKRHASAFTGTNLDHLLIDHGIDTLLITGTSTSGCVRSTAISGAGRHYRSIVVEQCVFEPRPICGPVALYELADRYADVVDVDEAIRYFR